MPSSIAIKEIQTTIKNYYLSGQEQKSKIFQKHFCQKVVLNLQNTGHIDKIIELFLQFCLTVGLNNFQNKI